MKQIRIFIGLKIGETLSFVGMYYLLCLLFDIIEPISSSESEFVPFWLGGTGIFAYISYRQIK